MADVTRKIGTNIWYNETKGVFYSDLPIGEFSVAAYGGVNEAYYAIGRAKAVHLQKKTGKSYVAVQRQYAAEAEYLGLSDPQPAITADVMREDKRVQRGRVAVDQMLQPLQSVTYFYEKPKKFESAPLTFSLEEAVELGLITREEAHQRREAGFTEAYSRWLKDPRAQQQYHKRREAHFSEQYEKILEAAGGREVHFDPKIGGYFWFIEEEPKKGKGIPGPGMGAREGSLGDVLQQAGAKLLDVEEGFFKSLTQPGREIIKEWDKESKELISKQNLVGGIWPYLGARGAQAVYGIFDALTFPIRPKKWGEAIGGLMSLGTSKAARAELGRYVAEDPFRFSVDIGSAVAGGYLFGKVASKVLDATLGPQKGVKEYVSVDTQIVRPRKITTRTPSRVKPRVIKDPSKVLHQKFKGWDRLPVDIEKSASEWFAGKLLGGRAADVLIQEPTRYIYKPRIDTVYGFKKVLAMKPRVIKSSYFVPSTRLMKDFYTVLHPAKDILPSFFAGLGGLSRVVTYPFDLAKIQPPTQKLEQAFKMKDFSITQPKLKEVSASFPQKTKITPIVDLTQWISQPTKITQVVVQDITQDVVQKITPIQIIDPIVIPPPKPPTQKTPQKPPPVPTYWLPSLVSGTGKPSDVMDFVFGAPKKRKGQKQLYTGEQRRFLEADVKKILKRMGF